MKPRACDTIALLAAPTLSLLDYRIRVFMVLSAASNESWLSYRFLYSLISAVFSCYTYA